MYVFHNASYIETPGVAPFVFYVKNSKYYVSREENKEHCDKEIVLDAKEISEEIFKNPSLIINNKIENKINNLETDRCLFCSLQRSQHEYILHEFKF